MAAVKLLLTCVLLTVGLLMLPSLTGTGVESMTARLWFFLAYWYFQATILLTKRAASKQPQTNAFLPTAEKL